MKKIHKYTSFFSVLLMFFIDFVGIGLVWPMLASMLYRTDIHHFLPPETSLAIRSLWLGVIVALMPIATFFSGPILGTLSDRIGRKKLMLTSIAFCIIGYSCALLGVLYKNIILLALSRIIVGIAAGNEAVGSAAIADMSTPEEKAQHFGLLHMVAGIGYMVGPFLGGQLSMVTWGMFSHYTLPFLCAGVLSIINLLTVTFLFKETHVGTNTQGAISFGISNIKKAWLMPGLFLLFVAIFFYNFGWAFYWEFIPTYWITAHNLTQEMIGNRYAFGSIVYALSSGLLINPFITRFAAEKILFYATLLCGISIGIPLIISSSWMYWIHIPIQQYLIALIFPVTATLISNKSSPAAQGEMMGILASVQSLANIASPLAAALLLGLSVTMPLIIGACGLLAGACMLQFFIKKSA